MQNLYEKNGLIFWSEEEITIRESMVTNFVSKIKSSLSEQNSAFQMIRCEAPLLTPYWHIHPNYTNTDIYRIDDLILRPETTAGSFEYAKSLLSGHTSPKWKLPIVVWQHGKSFRREQDQPTKFMRLKEFYQMEFQIIFSENTSNDYSIKLYQDIREHFDKLIGFCMMDHSDRLPSYSEETIDIICQKSEMEVCSMSKRKDFEGYKVIEIAIGTDRCVYNFLNK